MTTATSSSTPPAPAPAAAATDVAPAGTGFCDLSTQCGHCGGPMRQEHAHYRCTRCGQRDSCCDGPY
ncbi:hypothetical protein KSP35_02600 [Aquihabitans sp. G128]|uniref:hypothetical protein n=1 Tax=Aquihabitans sp. G128 TaxID=2849779 RepID=UPI001C22ABC9|nr:hypothetical protein [Aquihabitans sp. G128]QXC61753.1 hypothetical protein KSP35_02600 [Aquihabitans sp. G128]